jgi:hypothetical protein
MGSPGIHERRYPSGRASYALHVPVALVVAPGGKGTARISKAASALR